MNDEDLLLLSKQLHLAIAHLQKLPLCQISSLKSIMKEPTVLLWESTVSLDDVKNALIDHGVSLTAKDALFSTVIHALSYVIPDIYKYTSNDFQRLLSAVSKTPETKIVDVSILLAVWRYVYLIKRNAESHRQQADQSRSSGSREKAKLTIKDIANLFEVEQDLHHVVTSNLLYSHIKKCIKEDGRYLSVRSFFGALTTVCNIYLSEEQMELLSHILMETDIWLRDSEGASAGVDDPYGASAGVIDLHVLMQVVYFAIFKAPLVLPSGSSVSASSSQHPHRSAGSNSYVANNSASLAYSQNAADRARNMERGQGGSSMIDAFSDNASVYSEDLDGGLSRFASKEEDVGGHCGTIAAHPKVQNLLRAVSGYWKAIERCISVVMLKSFQNVIKSSAGPDADPAVQMKTHQMYGLAIITRELLTIAITSSSLPVTRADVNEIWKYIVLMKQRDGKLAQQHLSIDDQKLSLEEIKHYIFESQKYSRLDSGDQVERSTISRLMRDVDRPPMRGGGNPHPNSLDLNQWQQHEKSEVHSGGQSRGEAGDYADLAEEKSNVYMKIQQRLRALLAKNTESSDLQFQNFLIALCDGDAKDAVVLVTRGNFVAALKEVGVRVNKAEGDTVWSEAVSTLCDSHAPASSRGGPKPKAADNLAVHTFLQWLGLSVSPERVEAAIEASRERQRHAYGAQQQRRLGSGVKQVAYPAVSSPERPTRRIAGGGSFKPELQRGSEVFPSDSQVGDADAMSLGGGVDEFAFASQPHSRSQGQLRGVSFAGRGGGRGNGSVSLASYSEFGMDCESAQSTPGSPARSSTAAAGSKPTPRNNMSQLLQDNTEDDTYTRMSRSSKPTTQARPSSGLSQGSSVTIEAGSLAAMNTRSQLGGHNIRNLLAPAADFDYNDREPSRIEEETGGELNRYEIIAEMNKQKPMVAFLFRRLGGTNNSNHNATTGSRSSQFNIKAVDFADALIRPPLSLPLSPESAWELVCEMLRCSVNSPKDTTTIAYRDIMEFLDNAPADVVEEAYHEAKVNAREGGSSAKVLSPTKAQAVSYREEQVRRILVRQLVDSRHVQGDRLRMLSMLHPLRVRLRNMQSSGHTSAAGSGAGGSQRGQHGSRGEGFRSSGHTSYHTSWDTPDYCTVSELSKLLQSVDIVYTETELKYICHQIETQGKGGPHYATEVGVKLGAVVLYLSNLLIGAGEE